MKKLSVIAMIFILLSGCKTAPLAKIDGSQTRMADPSSYAVYVGRMGGEARMTNFKSVKPGPHAIQLFSSKDGDFTDRTWYFKAEACKKYYVAAKYENNNRYGEVPWEVDVIKIVPIPSCETPNED